MAIFEALLLSSQTHTEEVRRKRSDDPGFNRSDLSTGSSSGSPTVTPTPTPRLITQPEPKKLLQNVCLTHSLAEPSEKKVRIDIVANHWLSSRSKNPGSDRILLSNLVHQFSKAFSGTTSTSPACPEKLARKLKAFLMMR